MGKHVGQSDTVNTLSNIKSSHMKHFLDLINMATLTICTPEFVGLLLSSCVLVRNGRGASGVAIQVTRKQWHSPEEVLHPANVQSGDLSVVWIGAMVVGRVHIALI